MLSLPSKSMVVVNTFLSENRPLIFKYLTKKIKYALKKNIDKIELFEFIAAEKRHVAIIKQDDFESTLEDAIKEFTSIEQYEDAGKAQQVLSDYRQIQINRLLNDKPEG